MALAGERDAVVTALPWVSVRIDQSKLLAKVWFGDTAEYRVLLSDLDNVWEEELDTESIQSRAQSLNKRLRAPVQAFYTHLRSVAGPCLSGTPDEQITAAHFSLEHHGSDLTVRLKSELAEVPFYWEFRCTPAPMAVVSRHLVRPLLTVTQVLQRQVGELSALLVRKDAEIQDYKENGAVLSRGRLQTEPFEEEIYRENFITQTLPHMSKPQDNLEFDSELQQLYIAVNSVRNPHKRKRSLEHGSATLESFSFVPEHPELDQDQTNNIPKAGMLSARGSDQNNFQQPLGETQDADSEQTVPLTPAAAAAPVERLTTRPKKRKAVGLFR